MLNLINHTNKTITVIGLVIKPNSEKAIVEYNKNRLLTHLSVMSHVFKIKVKQQGNDIHILEPNQKLELKNKKEDKNVKTDNKKDKETTIAEKTEENKQTKETKENKETTIAEKTEKNKQTKETKTKTEDNNVSNKTKNTNNKNNKKTQTNTKGQ